jgi:alpha-amylase/alpha-mannosidase (GH57 family)
VAPRALVVHGHFYQPPRENPWLEAVEVQDSAAPYHDWNERVTAECYAPNTAARRLGAPNRILDVVNNFAKVSFNIGPTLMAWLERHAREVYVKIVEADRASVAARGHGNALAQAYNHMILPLATRRDKITQVRWGLADFRRRFGRAAAGMWLPETAVDSETLEVLAEAGCRLTILAPHQAWRVRPLGTEAWEEVGERVDPSRPYLWRGPHGRSLAVFFYDGPISRAIAFEDVLERGEKLVARLKGGFSDDRTWPQLVHCATDGESYGHHKPFGDMALAAALQQIESEGFAELTNYAAFLAQHPPTHEVQIREQSSWSCAHGVERWRADCGCRMRSDWQQAWRRPLREALDWLRDEIDVVFEARASGVMKDPWDARDAYIDVILDRTPEHVAGWLGRHQRIALEGAGRVEALRLLELERHRQLMYTSCGWFFDEISALEPTQVLKYAAIAMQYLRDLGGPALEHEFVRRLERAPSNVPEFRDGAEVYRRLIRPAVVDARRVVAHYAITGLFDDYPDAAAVYAYDVTRLDEAREAYDATALRIGRVRVESRITGDTREAMYAVLHFGGHDFSCGIRTWDGAATYDAVKQDLLGRYGQHSMADMIRGLDEHFRGELFGLTHLFIEERRRVLASVIRAVLDKHELTYRRIWEESRKLVRYLRQAEAPIPEVLAMTARHVLEQAVRDELVEIGTAGALPERVFELVAEARALGLRLDLGAVRAPVQAAVARALGALREEPSAARVAAALALVEGANRLGLPFGLWHAQNQFFALWRALPEARPRLAVLAEALGFHLAQDHP